MAPSDHVDLEVRNPFVAAGRSPANRCAGGAIPSDRRGATASAGERASLVGGALTAGPDGAGRFVVTVRIPTPAALGSDAATRSR